MSIFSSVVLKINETIYLQTQFKYRGNLINKCTTLFVEFQVANGNFSFLFKYPAILIAEKKLDSIILF